VEVSLIFTSQIQEVAASTQFIKNGFEELQQTIEIIAEGHRKRYLVLKQQLLLGSSNWPQLRRFQMQQFP